MPGWRIPIAQLTGAYTNPEHADTQSYIFLSQCLNSIELTSLSAGPGLPSTSNTARGVSTKAVTMGRTSRNSFLAMLKTVRLVHSWSPAICLTSLIRLPANYMHVAIMEVQNRTQSALISAKTVCRMLTKMSFNCVTYLFSFYQAQLADPYQKH